LEGIDGRYFGIDPVRSISLPWLLSLRPLRLPPARDFSQITEISRAMAANGVLVEIIFEKAIDIRCRQFAI
jgi:hypothetical protein